MSPGARGALDRRWRVIGGVVSWTAVALFTGWALGSALLGRTVFLGTDALVRFAPWAYYGFGDGTVVNGWVGDTIDSATPQLVAMRDSLWSGDFATWNPYVTGGTPLGSLPDSGLFNPLSWPWLVLPASYAPGAVKLLEIIAIAVGMILLGRRLHLSSAAQGIATLIFASSGFMVAWTNWPQTRVAALIPLLFWACDRAVIQRRVWDAVPVALVLGAMLLGGFPAIVGYAVYAVVAFAVVRLLAERAAWREWVRAVVVGAIGAALGVAIAAWQLLPFALNARSTINFGARAQSPADHLGLVDLATALVPGILGDPADPLWGTRWNPVERFSYLGVGAAVLLLAAMYVRSARSTRAMAWFSVGTATVCLVLMYVGGPFLAVAQELPVFSDNLVTRLRVILGFAVALGAAFGLDALLGHGRGHVEAEGAPVRNVGSRARWVVTGLIAAAATVGGAVIVREALYVVPAEAIDQVRTSTIVVCAVGAALGTLALLAWWRGRGWRKVVALAVPVVIAGQAIVVVEVWWPRSDPDTFYPVTAAHEFLADNLGEERFVNVGQTGLPGTSTYYGLRAATGHSFHTQQWRDLLEQADPNAMLSRTYSQVGAAGLASPALDRLGVRYGMADPAAEVIGDQEALGEVSGTATATAGSPLLTAPLAGPVQGIYLAFPAGFGGDGPAAVEVTVLSDGEPVAVTTRRIDQDQPSGGSWFALPAEGQGDLVQFSVRPLDGELELDVDAAGQAVGVVARAAGDDPVVVHAGDATVYERPTALSRIRWAGEAIVVPEAEQADLLGSGEVPDDTVVLSEPGQAADAGSTAQIGVVEERNSSLTLSVDADGAGYLVVADVMTLPGWSATVDGRPVSIERADHAVAAVHLAAGSHEVDFRYDPPGWRVGWIVTAVGWTGLAVLIVIGLLHRRRERSAAAREVRTAAPDDGTGPHGG